MCTPGHGVDITDYIKALEKVLKKELSLEEYKNMLEERYKKIRRSIKRTDEGSDKLKELAPELFDMLATITDRLNDITDSDEYDVPQEIGDELNDIQNMIWELLNRDGNLNGVAEYIP